MKKLSFLIVALLYYCGVEAQNVQTIGGHLILKSSGKYFELYPADTVEIDTTKIIITFTSENEETGFQKINGNGFTLKRKTAF